MKSTVKIKILETESPFKVLDINGEPGDHLDNHKVNDPALLLMRSGSIIYEEKDRTKVLSSGESCDIPPNVIHKVTCTTKAEFFVIMSKATTMKFEK